jgi:hypothetical protein
MKYFPRWQIACFAIAVLAVLLTGAWFFRDQERQQREEAEISLEAIGRLKVDQIALWRSDRLNDAYGLTNGLLFSDGVGRWMANPQAAGNEEIRNQLLSLRNNNHYADILLTDPVGVVRFRLSTDWLWMATQL